MDMMKLTTGSPAGTVQAGYDFAATLRPNDVVALEGGLGAGKTHFVKGVCSRLCPGAEVTSPTFNLVLEYDGDPPVFHFDMYRISSFDELYGIGFYDYLERGGVCLIEWSENIAPWLPDGCRRVRITRDPADDNLRLIEELADAAETGAGSSDASGDFAKEDVR